MAGIKVGAGNFCMGGGMAIAAAGTLAPALRGGGSFHGGRLATDQPTRPHLLAPGIQPDLYIAAAVNDGSLPPEMAARF
ncbi:dienelactone hydrolase family protein [Sphingomonas sp.]|uniref:dienelactone hydrolase family protein n=1 Tax=Sphingomonas sp. TaxID=28214 RepID=UPI003B004CE1